MVDHNRTAKAKASKSTPRHLAASNSDVQSPSFVPPGAIGTMADEKRVLVSSLNEDVPRFKRTDSERDSGLSVEELASARNALAASGQQAKSGFNQRGDPTMVLHSMQKGGVNAAGLTCGISEAKELVMKMTKVQAANPDIYKELAPLFLWAQPGIGKSSVIERAAKVDMGIGHIDFRLSELEPVDVRGMNLPDPASGRLKLVIPDEYPDPKRGDAQYGLINFDELSAVDRSLQVAAYRITLERNLGKSYSIPPGYYITACGNTKDDKAVSYTMSSALANRFCHLEIQADPDSLISHFRSKGQGVQADKDAMSPAERFEIFKGELPKYKIEHQDIHPDVPGFLAFKNEYAQDMKKGNPERGWPSGRSWERVSTFSKMQEKKLIDKREMSLLVQGLVGPGVAVEFMAYRELAAELPNALELLTNKERAAKYTMPDKPDQKYAMTSNFIYHMFREKDQAKDQVMADCFYAISDKMDSDFAVMLFMETVSKVKGTDRQRALTAHKDFTGKWIGKHLKSLQSKGVDFSTMMKP